MFRAHITLCLYKCLYSCCSCTVQFGGGTENRTPINEVQARRNPVILFPQIWRPERDSNSQHSARQADIILRWSPGLKLVLGARIELAWILCVKQVPPQSAIRAKMVAVTGFEPVAFSV